jgi:dTDP-4-dehydrorhamnose reductase
MKVAVIGANGQLGSDLCHTFEKEGTEFVPLTHRDIEVADMDSVKRALYKDRSDVIISTAAFVRVDDCELEPDICFRVNALGARNVAVAAQETGARFVFISSDYVFGSDSTRDIPYTEFDIPSPVNTLGHAKVAGERLVRHLCNRYFIIRVSGLFGVAGSSGKGGNFIETILSLARQGKELRVVNDQVFSPTCTKDLAEKIAELIKTGCYGTFHITNRGSCSWFEFASGALNLAGLKTPVVPITSEEWKAPARRPAFSVLDNYHLRLLGMEEMRPWQEALADYMREKGHIKQASRLSGLPAAT